MILHSYFRSSTSYRARIALNLKGVAYTQSPVNLKTGEQAGDPYRAVNPYGTVPALESESGILYQSLAIIDWLEQSYPNPSFLPADKHAAQICRELYYAVATEIHAVNNLPVLKELRSVYSADQSDLEAWYAKWIHRTFEPVEKRLKDFEWLSDGFPFGAPGLFEIVLIPQIYNANRWKTDLSEFPLLRSIDTACADIDSFQNAHPNKQPDATEDA